MPASHAAAIALGSNLGQSRRILTGALNALNDVPDIQVDTQSPFFRTAAVGPPQPDYLNACAILATTLSPRQLLQVLLDIEARFGRVRQERWGPRRLDLDLLLFDDWVVDEPGLCIPHPRMGDRAFVLVPLAEIAPDWVHPVKGLAIAQLLQRVDSSDIRLSE